MLWDDSHDLPGLLRNVKFHAGEALDFADEEHLVKSPFHHPLSDNSDGRILRDQHVRELDGCGVAVRDRLGHVLRRHPAIRCLLHHHILLKE